MMRNYKNGLAAAIHENAEALYKIGAIDKRTMKEFDQTCLMPVKVFTPEEIRALRERERMSQPVFARYFNLSKGIISAWERGTKKPSGPALRLLTLAEKKGIEVIV